MKTYTYYPKGTCSVRMDFTLDDEGIIRDFSVERGCNGNLKGIRSLIIGEKAESVISRLDGITCGMKMTSCPDQIAKGLKACLEGCLEGVEA